MRSKTILIVSALIAIFAFNSFDIRGQQSEKPALKKYAAVTVYDPARNAENDIQAAIAEAKQSKKRVLLEIGGNWCVWCRAMDAFFAEHADLLALREEKYITVKINVSTENHNKEALAKYPEISGYPHIFVLDSDGKLIQSQDTSELEAGRSYSLEKFTDFLKKWAL